MRVCVYQRPLFAKCGHRNTNVTVDTPMLISLIRIDVMLIKYK